MSHTVTMNAPETVWWFLLFPPLAALTLVLLFMWVPVLVREWWRWCEARFQARIDCALAYPLTFDQPIADDDWMAVAEAVQKVRNGWAA